VLAEGPPTETLTPSCIGALYDLAPEVVAPLLRR
jgi:hypothetical protein